MGKRGKGRGEAGGAEGQGGGQGRGQGRGQGGGRPAAGAPPGSSWFFFIIRTGLNRPSFGFLFWSAPTSGFLKS